MQAQKFLEIVEHKIYPKEQKTDRRSSSEKWKIENQKIRPSAKWTKWARDVDEQIAKFFFFSS